MMGKTNITNDFTWSDLTEKYIKSREKEKRPWITELSRLRTKREKS